ncbi:MAG: HAMP domain-containing histidine kinase [Bacteroidetes bacterium]|nr:HAMP domain-containing histidine kinase [Bacteroidota bacterium]
MLKLLRNNEEGIKEAYIYTMKMQQPYKSALIILIIVAAVVLPLLAYLQYTWLGQINEQEYIRMKNNLQTTAFHCSVDFSREIFSLIRSLNKEIKGSDQNIYRILYERISNWRATSANPGIITTEINIVLLPHQDQVIKISVNHKSTIFIYRDLSAIAIAVNDRPGYAAKISLDLENISSSVLPGIIQSNFKQDTWKDYDIVINNDTGLVVYRSSTSIESDISKKFDIVVPFLSLPPALISPAAPAPPDPGRFRADANLPPEPFNRSPFNFERDDIRLPMQDYMPPGGRERFEGQGLFKMFLRYRKSSLEEVVDNNRLRNLGISFSILILLGASIFFLLISTNSARRLAQQQLEFVAGISHELRTPLAVLKSAGENLADGVIREEVRYRQYGQLINSEVVRLSEMVEKALAYAGIQSGSKVYEKKLFDISTIIHEAIQNAKKNLPVENLVVETNIDEQLPLVLGDSNAIRSAIENLIVNGIKYSNEEKWIGIEIRYKKAPNNDFLEINIKDRGIGISNSDLKNIFKPFYRGENARDRQIQGNGLGLSIAKHIVASHGGIIALKSSTNSGSIFTIRIPARKQEDAS